MTDENEKLNSIKNSLLPLQDFPKFSAVVDDIKLIPNEASTRVIAIDVLAGKMQDLQSAIASGTGGDAKPPHITLCRVKTPLERKHVAAIKSLPTARLPFAVETVDLIESVLTRRSPVYESVAKYNLI